MPPSHTATSASHCSVFFAVSRRPRPPLGQRPRPGVVPPDGASLQPGPRTPTGISAAAGGLDQRPPPSTGQPLQRRLGPQPSTRPQPLSWAGPCIFRGPPVSRSAASPRPDWVRSHLGSRAPTGSSVAAGRLVQSPPLFWAVRPHAPPDHGPARGRGIGRAGRPLALKLAEGPFPPPSTFQGRHGGPNTPGRFRRLDPSARTPIGPERVCFCTFSRRPSGARNSGVRHLRVLGHAPLVPTHKAFCASQNCHIARVF
ncbi:hypothetical protein NDU88_002745 [Pleurodeles waltl]|uniref:Uncharacterized protein n=1 Tax=Pleurodeles waltl TaxID=8319 RepID=A0AAV7W5G3_PLEWA|nr:hypothetical protein NDU88_002745 [Pleurodeles waltl]